MVCPICKVKMVFDKRKGIEIEQCPDCHGVFIHDLEFDRLMYKMNTKPEQDKQYKRFDSKQKRHYLREYVDSF